ncbi:tyrosine-protein phosphatase non-receptor type 4-like isoform X2 [Pecten maximus]|uniref:tyrosine-protein phosphatase non-receptor type 4-like isoform X2 n=1 Tax=Pecten maximus TaxID=6579 RepID=UPI0014581A27|nr:tyrosine-protein phosphatase non-receptor type 4-like isoform X2 [Pecten maximus]
MNFGEDRQPVDTVWLPDGHVESGGHRSLADRIKDIVLDKTDQVYNDPLQQRLKVERENGERSGARHRHGLPPRRKGYPKLGRSSRSKSAGSESHARLGTFFNKSTTNFTDAEKLYHKLHGLSKVAKLGSISPKSSGLSVTPNQIDDSLDTNTKSRNPSENLRPDMVVNVQGSESNKDGGESGADAGPHQSPHLVVRQCRIGSSMAFGLVQVNQNPNGNGYPEGHGLVTIRMIPDEQGRFGFNVKGGADQGMPIIVSRVAPSTPADLAIPRLNEGDQVLVINGRDVSQHTHEQVVMFIRASRETHSGELVLIVRPNVYVSEDTPEEHYFEYLPESHVITTTAGANALEASLVLLQESLEGGAALAQFEQLYRKKPGMTMNAARLETNIPKNRYRDISPYDQTRVILKSGGEYINANYVNMEIPGSGIVNRYIAAQGPLPNTCVDFWQMVWEQHSSLVVMLTTKIERGRVKCHQYWPDLYETVDYGELQITCVKEEDTTSFAFREFNLTHLSTNEERHISHMQYIAWPDHGVPDDPGDFLDFVGKVRQKRTGMVEPTIVHCSAGIGRTGVLITMETAMCLIESNQPVYPLSIVRQMRDQRAMLIQTPSQYKFVCEAILKTS